MTKSAAQRAASILPIVGHKDLAAALLREDRERREMERAIMRSRMPHGSCATNACTHCDAQKALDKIGRRLARKEKK